MESVEIYIEMGVKLKLEGFKHLSTVQKMLNMDLQEYMMAYFCNHLSDNNVNFSKKKSQLIV